jgi:hypothetical protein
VYPVHHLPIIKASADQLGLVSSIHHLVPTERAVDGGTIVLGRVWDTLSRRSPRSRLEELLAHQDPELLLGKALPPPALHDEAVGRVLGRLYDLGTLKIVPACAVRAGPPFGGERREGHCETTSCSGWGESAFAETQDGPCRVT